MTFFFPFFFYKTIFFHLNQTVMLIIGRITSDAVVKSLKDQKEVVNFSVAVNDYYKPKNGEGVKTTTYFNCSYWLSSKMAARLTKGTLVELNGRISVNAYLDKEGNPKGSLNCHVNNITIHQSGSGTIVDSNGTLQPSGPAAQITEPVDDLPF
jgi:single-strand DNA-binding protein